MRVVDRSQAIGIAIARRGQVLSESLTGDSRRAECKQSGYVGELAEDRRNAAGRMDVLNVPLAIAVPCRRHLCEVRHALGHLVHPLDRVFDSGFTSEGEHVEHRVRRPAHRHVERHRVVDRVGGDDIEKTGIGLDQAHDLCRRALSEGDTIGRRREDGAVAGERDAKRLAQAVHRVRREHAAARAAGRTGERLELEQPVVIDGAGCVLPDTLENRDEIDFPARSVDAGRHWAAGDKDRRQVHPGGAHQHSRNDLVAVGDADQTIEAMRRNHRLDAVGDQLPRRQREMHSGMAHRDAVVDADGVELERHPARGSHRVLDHPGKPLQVRVTRHDVHVRIAHRDERLVEVGRVEDLSRRAQQRPVWCARRTSFDRV